MTVKTEYDALVVGTGFGGIHQIYQLAKLGLSIKAIDRAGGPGGTWYWNRYPGAMTDSEALVYRFSWDLETLRTYPWPNRYVRQPEVLAYLEYITDRYNLRRYMQFNTEFLGAEYDEVLNVWNVETTRGAHTVRYLITALGVVTKENWPSIPNRSKYRGEMFHSANIPKGYSFKGKKVGVIGTSSSGIQIISALAPEVEHLTCFQRRAQYIVPAGDMEITKEFRDNVNRNYEGIWDQARERFVGMGFEESTISALETPDKERERVYSEAWDRGNGHQFMFGTFADIVTNEDANRTASDFIRRKIDQIVKNPETAEKLKPTDLYARRPLCASAYYETFNRENVDLVDVKSTPFQEFMPDGIKTADGVEHKLDVVVCATGFDGVDGSYSKLHIRGRGGKSLSEHWGAKNDPSTYLGCTVAGFPNLLLIVGPKTAFANMPTVVEAAGELTSKLIARAEKLRSVACAGRQVVIEPTRQAEQGWCEVCDKAMMPLLFNKCESWLFRTGVESRKKPALFYWGGLGSYRSFIKQEIESDYKGFEPFLQ